MECCTAKEMDKYTNPFLFLSIYIKTSNTYIFIIYIPLFIDFIYCIIYIVDNYSSESNNKIGDIVMLYFDLY